tara:strand:+ start:73 stop:531 length:459 start_codon:yes stop_codon:yes gene_type:complete
MKKVNNLRQPEGGFDVFKKKPIPKKPRQPEGSGASKKSKLIQRQPEGFGASKKSKLIQRQPETSSGKKVLKKITGKQEFADTDKKKSKTSSPSTFGAAFKAARTKLGAGKTFTYKGKKFSTNRADDKKKTKKIDFSKIVSSAKKSKGKKAST